MTPHLAHLLCCVYDDLLAPAHRDDLHKSTITEASAAAQFIRSVPVTMIPRVLGFDLPGIQSALLFPYRSAAGGFMAHARLKIFPALTDRGGYAIKYLQPKGSTPRLYFVASCLGEVLEGGDPLWICEGEKKAICLAQLGRPAVGIAGVECWHTKGSRELLADFDAIRLDGRVIELLPDNDYHHNPNVRRAIIRLGEALAARGARPRVVLLPRELPR